MSAFIALSGGRRRASWFRLCLLRLRGQTGKRRRRRSRVWARGFALLRWRGHLPLFKGARVRVRMKWRCGAGCMPQRHLSGCFCRSRPVWFRRLRGASGRLAIQRGRRKSVGRLSADAGFQQFAAPFILTPGFAGTRDAFVRRGGFGCGDAVNRLHRGRRHGFHGKRPGHSRAFGVFERLVVQGFGCRRFIVGDGF